jgi:hypothetical protein
MSGDMLISGNRRGIERFYISDENGMTKWAEYAVPRIDAPGEVGTLARALCTLIDAYHYAQRESSDDAILAGILRRLLADRSAGLNEDVLFFDNSDAYVPLVEHLSDTELAAIRRVLDQ